MRNIPCFLVRSFFNGVDLPTTNNFIYSPLAPQEESLEEIQESASIKKLFKGSSYANRNVYKSILRNIEAYVKNNEADLINILTKNGYTNNKIITAFVKIGNYNKNERKRGNTKLSQLLIKKMLTKKTIFTYILRETLYAMIQQTERGSLGKIEEKSYKLYYEVSSKLYKETVSLLGKATEGLTHLL